MKVTRRATEDLGEPRRGRGRYDRTLTAEQRAQAQRRAIVDACQQLLTQGGECPTVSDVVAASGVGRNTFYEHFDQAGSVVREVLDAAQSRLEECLRAGRVERRWGPAETIRGLSRAWADSVRDEQTMMTVLVEHRRAQLVAMLRREIEGVARVAVNAGYCPKRALDPLRLRALAAAGVELVPELTSREGGAAREVFGVLMAAGLRAN